MRGMVLASASLACMAAPATAQTDPASPESPEIIVQGDRDRDAQITHFVNSLTPAPVGGQLARYEHPICPSAIGLRDRQRSFVVNRMRSVAKAAGLPLARPGCDPNAILIVTADKEATLKHLQKQRPDFFPAGWDQGRISNLQRDPSPVAAWQIEELRRSDGKEVSEFVVRSHIAPADLAGVAQKTTELPSRATPLARPHFLASVVIVQADALTGLTLTQLAAYAAMRAFVRTDPDRLAGSTREMTILSAIETPMGAPVPLTLTEWDLSFLKAFYSSSENGYARYQRSHTRGLMKQNLEQ